MSNRTTRFETTCPTCQTAGAVLNDYTYYNGDDPKVVFRKLTLDCPNGCTPTDDQLEQVRSAIA